jgi:putative toxin-antitoxin system antitoxin component (TIGR02293 family)
METQAIAEILGGRKVLGKPIKSHHELAHVVRKGLPAGSITALAEKLHVGNPVLSRMLGIPQRTLTRRLSQLSLLTPAESDRTVRMARVYANAIELIGDEQKAIEWLSTPNRALAGI